MKRTEVTINELAHKLLSLGSYTKKELSEALDISRPTLDSRLSGKTNWRKLEIKFIIKKVG